MDGLVGLVVGAVVGAIATAVVFLATNRRGEVAAPPVPVFRPAPAPPPPPPPAPVVPRFEPAPLRAPEPASARRRPAETSDLEVVSPDRLPRFADVGGMEAVKTELSDTLGPVLADPAQAVRYRITWNGVLLHGPPGTGKSFLARAAAGEFGCSLVEVDTADLVSSDRGGGPARVERAFATAARHLPCVLVLDELDSVAADRADATDPGEGSTVLTQLLQSIEEWRKEPRLVVMATTNAVDELDPAVTRPGRFDRHVRVDLPDHAGRVAVLRAALRDRPLQATIDLDTIARRTARQTPASLAQLVELAALAAFRQSSGTGRIVQISYEHLDDALEQRGGKDRPTVEEWSWERLVLDERVLAELRQVQELIEDPEKAAAYGVDPPSGLLLVGPPGTGKTTIAKVLAAEAACSFYPVTASDLTSKWVGESERAVARLFRRARANCPSIVFLDEVDAIGAGRGQLSAYDRQLDQLLAEMDGISTTPGVYVVGATNRPQSVDPALRRGGRLSRTIELPLPGVDQRRRLLEQLTASMPLVDVDLAALAADTEGLSGADLKALLQQAALEAMIRQAGAGTRSDITRGDIERALYLANGHASSGSRPRRRRPAAP
ncbi:MAG TPA: AAA family ATPase [Acidimicrobiales bacterium]|nr:AAA family ATPase [Acidimicrobiales bacterium]